MKAVLALILLSVFAVQAFTAPMLRAAECPAAGDTVTFKNVREVYASMTSSVTTADLTKGEFETTAQFKARKAKTIATADFLQPVLLEGTYKSYYAKYDADKQRFIIETQAWDDNLMVDWKAACGLLTSRCGIKPRFLGDLNQGVGLAEDHNPGRSYRASNAFGVEVTVRVLEGTVYGVFDKPLPLKPRSSHEASRAEWAHELTTGEYSSPAVVLPLPLQRAAELKERMRVGVMVRPKEPFTVTGWDHKQPDIEFKTEQKTEINLIVADILCAVITDQNGVVLKTVAPGG